MIREFFHRLFQRKESATQKAVLLGANSSGWSKEDLEKVAREAFEGNVIANAAITGITDAIAGVEWYLEAADGSEVPNYQAHPLMVLWNRPNPTMSRASFLRAVGIYYFAEGNSYIERTEGKVELWPLRPDRVTIKVDTKAGPNPIPWYEYKAASETVKFPFERVLHLRVFSPTDDWYGKSPLLVGATVIDTDNEAVKWNCSLVRNGARPSGILEVEGILPEAERERLKEQIRDNWYGRNSLAPKLLENGLKWTATGFSPTDMDFAAGLRILARRICTVLDYPPELAGDSENKTYSNYMEARQALYQDVVCPFLDYIRDEMNHWLAPVFGTAVKLQYDRDDIEALQENRQTVFDRIAAADWLTLNEQREATGYARIEDEKYDVPRAETAAAPLMGGFPGGLPEEEEEEGEEAAPAPAGEAVPAKGIPLYWGVKTVEEKARAFAQIEKERGVFSRQIAKALRAFFRREKARIQEILRRHRDHPEEARGEIEAEIDSHKAALVAIYRKWFPLAARWFFNRVRNGIKSDRVVTETKAVADSLREMRVFFRAEIPKRADLIAATSKRQIANILQTDFDAGANPEDTVDKLMALYDEHYAGPRADTIADSEMVAVSNYGANMGAKSTELVVVKHWQSMRDGRVRDSHIEADDKYVGGIPIDDPFLVGTDTKYEFQFPGDLSGNPPIEEWILCRCWVTYSEAE